MTDSTLNRFLANGTHAARLSFTPAPPTPASGPSPTYFWFETDTSDSYAWNSLTSAFVKVNTGGSGTVTTTGSPASGNLTKFSGASSITSGDLSGDVTTSGALATTISANAVSTSKINNAAVTLAKIANASANNKLLGAGAAGSGNPYVEITLGAGLTMTGTTLSASGGGGTPGTPAIRGSSITSAATANITVTWPVGTVAGDVAFIFYGGGFQLSPTPAGWQSLAIGTGGNFNGDLIAKVMTAGDITAGSVSIPTGSFDAIVAQVMIDGTTFSGVIGFPFCRQNGSGILADSATQFGIGSTDLVIAWGGNRANNTVTAAFTGSTQLRTVSAGNASGVVSAGVPASIVLGATASFTFSSSGSGYSIIMISLRGV